MKDPTEIDPVKKRAVRVLVADENALRRQQALAWMSGAGYEVFVAGDGFEALSKVIDDTPDIVFANTSMARLDGYQLCSLIKSNSDFQLLPVIMLVNDAIFTGSERASLSGCDSLLCKPANARAFVSIVDQFVSVSQS